MNANVSFANTAPATPFGEWARLYQHITDNDKCTENTSCAWLVSDPLRTAFFPDMGFGPGSAVVRNWLDDIFVSPWVSLASTPSASGSILSYRIFGGNFDSKGRINLNWSSRSKVKLDNTDTSTLGDSVVVVGPWGHVFNWLMLDFCDHGGNIVGEDGERNRSGAAFRAAAAAQIHHRDAAGAGERGGNTAPTPHVASKPVDHNDRGSRRVPVDLAVDTRVGGRNPSGPRRLIAPHSTFQASLAATAHDAPHRALTLGRNGVSVVFLGGGASDGRSATPESRHTMSASQFSRVAATTVRVVNRIPVVFWAAWILGVLIGTAALAFNTAAPPSL